MSSSALIIPANEKPRRIIGGDVFDVSRSLFCHIPPTPLFQKVRNGVLCLWFLPVLLGLLSCFTCLSFLPLVGSTFTSFVASHFIPFIMGRTDKLLRNIRKELLKNISGVVLDFGAGSGIYMKYCFPAEVPGVRTTARPDGGGSEQEGGSIPVVTGREARTQLRRVTRYIALEPNTLLHSNIREQERELRKGYSGAVEPPEVEVKGQYLEDYCKGAVKQQLDWIILGNVLCEVPDPETIVRQLDSLLKPGGKVFFCEHVRYPASSWKRQLQDILNPWWSRVSDGCNCNRASIEMLERSRPNWVVESWTFDHVGVMPWNTLFKIGLAVKTGGVQLGLAEGVDGRVEELGVPA